LGVWHSTGQKKTVLKRGATGRVKTPKCYGGKRRGKRRRFFWAWESPKTNKPPQNKQTNKNKTKRTTTKAGTRATESIQSKKKWKRSKNKTLTRRGEENFDTKRKAATSQRKKALTTKRTLGKRTRKGENLTSNADPIQKDDRPN